MNFEEQYEDVLQNIEFGIVRVYREHPEMIDWQALDAIQALIRLYQAQAQSRPEPKVALQPLAQEVFDSALIMCEWRLGRGRPEPSGSAPIYTQTDAGHGTYAGTRSPLPDWARAAIDWFSHRDEPKTLAHEETVENESPSFVGPKPITLDEIVACLKRIRKSIQFWTKEGGRQGYLNYVNGFIA